jgi:TolB-like protein/DNA-binding winged helix-turn-helix (wHTH) protein/Tfp pilus assembly protein PilF
MEPQRRASVLRFGHYELDLHSGEVRKGGMRIRVQQQPLKLLEILLEHPGEMVTREELSTRIWPNESFGDFDQAVNVAVTKLRAALEDSAENPQYIETLPKRGYRFIAQVATVGGPSPDPTESPGRNASGAITHDAGRVAGMADAPAHLLSLRRWKMIAFALLVCLLVLAGWVRRSNRSSSSGIRSLAVLPLDNLSGDASQDYFADGMTDELITDLAQISALRVISRTSVMSYKHARKPLPEIARELNVDAVIEGTVLRSGDQVRITAQLIQATADKHLWAKSYEGNLRDTLAVQKRVADDIAEQIRIELTPQERTGLKNVKAVNPEAYEDYLKGRYFWNKRTPDGLKKAIDYFNQAIAKDPSYAQAYSGLASSYVILGAWQYALMDPKDAYPRAKAAATKALELDNTLGEAHTSLALSIDMFVWDWEAAEREYRRGIELNPSYATGHQWYAEHLSETGRNDEAIAEIRKAESLDPLSLIIGADVPTLLVIARRYDEAIEHAKKTIELEPKFAVAHFALGMAYEQKGKFGGAITAFQKAVEFSGGNTAFKSNLAHAYAVAGRRSDALAILNELKDRSKHEFLNPSEIALIYVGLDQKDQAMVWLEKAYEGRFDPVILTWPAFDPLRSDPRFQDLVRRIGLPQ